MSHNVESEIQIHMKTSFGIMFFWTFIHLNVNIYVLRKKHRHVRSFGFKFGLIPAMNLCVFCQGNNWRWKVRRNKA